jgi:hypothetical protein
MQNSVVHHLICFVTIVALQPHKVLLTHKKPVSIYNILQFCQDNSLKYITFVTIDKDSPGSQLFLSQLITQAHLTDSIRSRLIKTKRNDVGKLNLWPNHEYDKDTLVVISSPDTKDWMHYLELISITKIRSSIFVIVEPLENNVVQEIRKLLSKISENVYFYLLYTEETSEPRIMWEKLITLKHNPQVVSNELHFDSFGRMVEEYDMQGLHIKCSTLSWAPYLSLKGCDEVTGKDCKSEGYIADVMNLLGNSLNFTWHCDAEPNNDWGVTQKSGSANVNGTWGGVVGDVVNGDYPLCLSFWTNTYSRIGMMDFVIMGEGVQYVMALIPQLPKYDTGLFTRPLRNNVWITIGVISFIVVACIIVSGLASKTVNIEHSIRIVKSIAWLTFFLLLVHYEGALTMFFTTEITVPFESRDQAMKAYPEWKTMIRRGNDRNFKEQAEEGVPIYIEFWKRLQETPDEVYYGSISDGVELIRNDQVIIHISGKALRQYFKSNPSGLKPKTFPSEGENLAENMVVTENSPLAPILSFGCISLRETGIMGTLDTQWMGKDVTDGGGGGAIAFALGPGQVMMIFAILCASIGVSFVVLIIEYAISGFL